MRSTGRLLLRKGIVMTMDPQIEDLSCGDVLVEAGTITSVGADLDAEADVVIDCAGKIVIPGFVNSHHHMFQTALRSYWADGLFADYIAQSRFGPEAIFHQYTPEDVYWGQFAGALENLAAGTTTVVDTSQCSYTPAHTDAALDAIRRSGLRCVFSFSPVFGNEPNPEYAHPQDIRRLVQATDAVKRDSGGEGRVCLALGYHVDTELFRLAHELGLPVFAHVNDANWGRALEALEVEGLLGPWATYIHCLELEDSTWDVIERTGGKVSVSCLVEQTLEMGLPALQPALDRQIPVGLGTDAVSLGPVDFFSQMRAVYALHRSVLRQTGRIDATADTGLASTRDILRLATLGGARAAHLDHLVGSLTPGKRADIVVLNGQTLNAGPVMHATGAVVQLMDTSNVDTVVVDGQVVKKDGRLVGIDIEDVMGQLARSASGLLERSGYPEIVLTSCREDMKAVGAGVSERARIQP